MSLEGAELMPTAVQGMGECITSSRYAKARAERCQKMAEGKDTEQFITCVKMMSKQRW